MVRNPVVNGSRIRLSVPEPGVSGKYPGNGDRKTFRNTASGIRWKITGSDSFPPYLFDLGGGKRHSCIYTKLSTLALALLSIPASSA
ncbi:unnamed protein product, partial [Rotaria magnacalcarata]